MVKQHIQKKHYFANEIKNLNKKIIYCNNVYIIITKKKLYCIKI